MHMPPVEKSFEAAPAGTHLAVCYGVIDLGTQADTYQGKPVSRPKLWLSFELPNEPMDSGEPFVISKRYTFSSSRKSNLRHDLEAWRGQPFEDSEIQKFDIKNIIGKACLLTIVHKTSGDQTYANIVSIAGLPKGTEMPEMKNHAVYLSLAPERFDRQVFEGLSETLKNWISTSPEYKRLAKTSPTQTNVPDDAIPF